MSKERANKSGEKGKITTFYSYKGGAGRTMALANVAWILADNGYKVLLIDWDLEAPGLHRYFSPFINDPEVRHTRGLIELLLYCIHLPKKENDPSLLVEQIQDYIIPIKWDFDQGGKIDFISAGKQDDKYVEQVTSFDWDKFFHSVGKSFVDGFREKITQEYDYTFIDSRTGIWDKTSLCTVLLPDYLALFFTMNNQSTHGCHRIAKNVMEIWGKSDVIKNRKIYPIPSRVEKGESQKLQVRREYIRSLFAEVHEKFIREENNYWNTIEIPAIPIYNFEEGLAVFKEENMPGSLLYSMQNLSQHFVNTNKKIKIRNIDEDKKIHILSSYSRYDTAQHFEDKYKRWIISNSSDDFIKQRLPEVELWAQEQKLSSIKQEFLCQSIAFQNKKESQNLQDSTNNQKVFLEEKLNESEGEKKELKEDVRKREISLKRAYLAIFFVIFTGLGTSYYYQQQEQKVNDFVESVIPGFSEDRTFISSNLKDILKKKSNYDALVNYLNGTKPSPKIKELITYLLLESNRQYLPIEETKNLDETKKFLEIYKIFDISFYEQFFKAYYQLDLYEQNNTIKDTWQSNEWLDIEESFLFALEKLKIAKEQAKIILVEKILISIRKKIKNDQINKDKDKDVQEMLFSLAKEVKSILNLCILQSCKGKTKDFYEYLEEKIALPSPEKTWNEVKNRTENYCGEMEEHLISRTKIAREIYEAIKKYDIDLGSIEINLFRTYNDYLYNFWIRTHRFKNDMDTFSKHCKVLDDIIISVDERLPNQIHFKHLHYFFLNYNYFWIIVSQKSSFEYLQKNREDIINIAEKAKESLAKLSTKYKELYFMQQQICDLFAKIPEDGTVGDFKQMYQELPIYEREKIKDEIKKNDVQPELWLLDIFLEKEK